jgi:hypothetical protein
MKDMRNSDKWWIAIMCLLYIVAFFAIPHLVKKENDFKVEYRIELESQSRIKLYSVSSGTTYVTSPDSIMYYLDLDNR